MEEQKTTLDSTLGGQDLPNATAVLVLGILSIPFCCCFMGTLGIALSIVALVLASKDLKKYNANPEMFSAKSYKNLNAGRICAIVGLCLSGLYLIMAIIGFIVGGMWDIPQDPTEWQDFFEEFENMD